MDPLLTKQSETNNGLTVRTYVYQICCLHFSYQYSMFNALTKNNLLTCDIEAS